MKQVPKISVIIPIYNCASYLECAIDSIINQTFQDIEIILVNDGSTDGSAEVIDRYKDNRIIVLHQKNMGVSMARNSGYALASGEYIYFFDSDDYLEPDALAVLYSTIESSGCDLLSFDGVIMDAEEDSVSPYKREGVTNKAIYNGVEMVEILTQKDIFSPVVWLNFIRKSYLDAIKITFQKGIIHEDALYTFMLLIRSQRVIYLKRSLYHRRVREDSITSNAFSMINVEGMLAVTNNLLPLLKEDKRVAIITDQYIKKIIASIASSSLSMSFMSRMKILQLLMGQYLRFLKFKSILLIFFPFLKR